MDEGVPTEVEVVCTEGRTVRPVRVLWAGRRLTLVDWDEVRAGADVWAGEAVAEDGRRLRLSFSRGRGGWRVAEVSEPAPSGAQGRREDAASWWRRRTAAAWGRRDDDGDGHSDGDG